ncbi:MAG: hypothetical protein HY954_00540 [Deltaproteobacteria bacterium]|nr:hypothetical protein [Deltaproteobacteria bacterium]
MAKTAAFDETPVTDHDRLDYARKVTMVVYALQAVGLFIGITYIAAVIINYLKADDVKNTWLESHFRWQIRTFWASLIIGVIGVLMYLLLVGYLIIVADGVWVVYRIIKGFLSLKDNKEMYRRAF